MPSTSNHYKELVSAYIEHNFSGRGLEVFFEVEVGTSLVGKRRFIDIFVSDLKKSRVLGIECKFQATPGTADEKLVYALEDLERLKVPTCLVYAGNGFSPQIVHHLQASPLTAYCYPKGNLERTKKRLSVENPFDTWQLDLSLALAFEWWDIVLENRQASRHNLEQVLQHAAALEQQRKSGLVRKQTRA